MLQLKTKGENKVNWRSRGRPHLTAINAALKFAGAEEGLLCDALRPPLCVGRQELVGGITGLRGKHSQLGLLKDVGLLAAWLD